MAWNVIVSKESHKMWIKTHNSKNTKQAIPSLDINTYINIKIAAQGSYQYEQICGFEIARLFSSSLFISCECVSRYQHTQFVTNVCRFIGKFIAIDNSDFGDYNSNEHFQLNVKKKLRDNLILLSMFMLDKLESCLFF